MMDLVKEEYLYESIYTNIQIQGENVHGLSLRKPAQEYHRTQLYLNRAVLDRTFWM